MRLLIVCIRVIIRFGRVSIGKLLYFFSYKASIAKDRSANSKGIKKPKCPTRPDHPVPQPYILCSPSPMCKCKYYEHHSVFASSPNLTPSQLSCVFRTQCTDNHHHMDNRALTRSKALEYPVTGSRVSYIQYTHNHHHMDTLACRLHTLHQ